MHTDTTSWSKSTVQRQVVTGSAGVAAQHKLSVQAGIDMLHAGGNAVDAGVAAALVAGVVEPQETTLGGSGFAVVQAPGKDARSVEFGPMAPEAATPDMFDVPLDGVSNLLNGVYNTTGNANRIGPLAAGIPRTLPGLVHLHDKYGRLPRADVMRPAIVAAGEGFDAYLEFAALQGAFFQHLWADPYSREIYFPGGVAPSNDAFGRTLTPPTRIKNPALHRTLQQIADEGIEPFLHGSIAKDIEQTMREVGGIIRATDLAASGPDDVPARSMTFRGHTVWGATAPSGTLTQFQALKTWEAIYPTAPSYPLSPESHATLANVLQYAFADRYHWLGDPRVVPVPEAGLLADDYTRSVVNRITSGEPNPIQAAGEPPWQHFSGNAPSDPWRFEPDGQGRQVRWTPPVRNHRPPAGTTHISAMDGDGMAVSITHTAASMFGACVVCPRTGIAFDSSMAWFNPVPGAANSVAPRARALANMGPMVVSRDNQPVIALGAPGGRRIVSALVQVLIHLLESSSGSAAEVMSVPRLDASSDSIIVSSQLPSSVEHLRRSGFKVVEADDDNMPLSAEFARPVVVVRQGAVVEAAVEPSSPGTAATI